MKITDFYLARKWFYAVLQITYTFDFKCIYKTVTISQQEESYASSVSSLKLYSRVKVIHSGKIGKKV
jgi:hypothetical protein